MRRRKFVSATARPGWPAAAPADPPKNQFFHLVYYYMRTGSQVDRTTQYLNTVFLPGSQARRIGHGRAFSAPLSASAALSSCRCDVSVLAAMETIHNRFADDKEFVKGWDDYNNIADPAYVRMESALLRAFDGMAGDRRACPRMRNVRLVFSRCGPTNR